MLALDDRPFSFEAICGQKAIVAEMKRRSLTKDFPTVMFFAGDSGVGKTTLALIVAALINDPNPLKGDGCLDPNPDSPESRAILDETFNMSCSMYDASKMAKEDVIALEDVVGSESFFGGKRVVIIDEAQELSRTSKGVTLKLLEKKRSNVNIILCAMNPDAFDVSVRSRGLFYKFRSPSSSDIAEYLFGALDRHGLADKVPESFVSEGIFTIAENCEGSVRLAVQTLERCVAGGFYTPDAITDAFGLVSRGRLFDVVRMMLDGDKRAFEEIRKLDLREFYFASYRMVSECLVYLRTGVADAQWKADQFKALAGREEALQWLFYLYTGIETAMAGGFKPHICIGRLSEVCSPMNASVYKPVAPRGQGGYRTR